MFFEACPTTTGICRSRRLRNSRSTTLRSSELSSSTFSITRISRIHSEDRAVTIRLRILQQQPVQVSAFGPKTPDVTSSNPVLGSGGHRAIQLGLKIIF